MVPWTSLKNESDNPEKYTYLCMCKILRSVLRIVPLRPIFGSWVMTPTQSYSIRKRPWSFSLASHFIFKVRVVVQSFLATYSTGLGWHPRRLSSSPPSSQVPLLSCGPLGAQGPGHVCLVHLGRARWTDSLESVSVLHNFLFTRSRPTKVILSILPSPHSLLSFSLFVRAKWGHQTCILFADP